MDNYNIKRVQERILSIFIEVDKLCSENNICYFAIGGTCLGAVRHNGFIPWDDDLDIAMPRDDYERFIAIAERQLPSHLTLVRPDECEHYECIFCKVQDVSTTFIQTEVFKYPDRYTGVYIDIMPLDGLPGNKVLQQVHFKKLQIYGDLNINRRRDSEDIHAGWKKWCWRKIKKILDRYEFAKFYDLYVNELSKYPIVNTKYTCYGWCEMRNRLIFPMKDFMDYTEIPFENYSIRCPVGYDDYLTVMFGSYMKIPPKEQCVPGHTAFIDLDCPFSFYQENGIPERNLK